MMLLLTLLRIIRCANPKIVMAYADKLILPEDQADFEHAGDVLWEKEGLDYRKEIAMQMGWGVICLYMMERAVDNIEDSDRYFNANLDQRLDRNDQNVAMAEIIEEYVLILNKERRLPEWILMNGKEEGDVVTLRSPDLLELCFEVLG